MTPDEIKLLVALERRRCVALVLSEVTRQRIARRRDIADVLSELATRMEHGE